MARETLKDDLLVLTKIGWPVPHLVYAAMLLSTNGAALQSLAGAPRLLAAIGRDRLIPQLAFFDPPAGQEPRRAVLLTAMLSFAVTMIGELNLVAPFITMWFLTCYAIINGACFILA